MRKALLDLLAMGRSATINVHVVRVRPTITVLDPRNAPQEWRRRRLIRLSEDIDQEGET